MLSNRVLCKDGGFSTQLAIHVGNKVDGDPLWSSRFNATNPDVVVQTHLDFLNAGADIILTNTYQASTDDYMKYLNIDREQSIELIKETVRLAHRARDKFLSDAKNTDVPLIFGSIGSFGAHLHDGSEYTASFAERVTKDELSNWHRTRINAVLAVGVDALAIETIPCQIEAEALVELMSTEYPNVKFWISLQCKDETSLAHGESFHDVGSLIWDKMLKGNSTGSCLAIGANCLHPQFVSPLFESLNGNRANNNKIPLVVYPNSGEVYDVQTGWSGKADCIPLHKYAPDWIKLGVRYIGGCCRTSAPDITDLKQCVLSISK